MREYAPFPRREARRQAPSGADPRSRSARRRFDGRETPWRVQRGRAPSARGRAWEPSSGRCGGGRLVLKSTASTSSAETASRSIRPLARAPGRVPAGRRRWPLPRALSGAKAAANRGSDITARVSSASLSASSRRYIACREIMPARYRGGSPAQYRAGAPAARAQAGRAGTAPQLSGLRGEKTPGSSSPAASEGRISRGAMRSARGFSRHPIRALRYAAASQIGRRRDRFRFPRRRSRASVSCRPARHSCPATARRVARVRTRSPA